MERAAFQAVYSDLKLVKTRSVAVISLEIPIEKAEGFVREFGLPTSSTDIWCAVAKLQLTKETPAEPETAPGPETEQSRPLRAHGRGTMTTSARAAILCGDPAFQRWLGVDGTEAAATEVRRRCAVPTRSLFDSDRDARQRWLTLLTTFEAATGRMAEIR